MIKKRALKYYHGPERYGCAQAILKTFEKTLNVTQEMIDSFKAFSGGRADGGLCGALYAAKVLVDDPEKADIIQAEFIKVAGSAKCKEIKKLKKIPCTECVTTAAELLQNIIDQNKSS